MQKKITQELIVITSPPASGKTYWVSSLIDLLGNSEILVISPLRALADECRQKWGDSVIVMTPEEWLKKKIIRNVVVFDEFHLYFYWGDTFRPIMWEVFYELSEEVQISFLLTATLSDHMIKEVGRFQCQFDRIQWFDYGNRCLKFLPQKYIKAPSRSWIERLILLEKKSSSVRLIFCKYREEVFTWEKKLKSLGYSVISCVGGEASEMRLKIKALPHPDFIVSTTVLSHGVNLPLLEKIFFLYPVENIDFWIQMVARGGRKGEKFNVIALENPHGIKWSFWTNLLAILWISFKMKLLEELRPMWFLKD